MPLQNRVDPFGSLFADPARGLLMGNRGGRLHDEYRKLGARRWASKQWIYCLLEFNNRHRNVWGDSYSELFFLDEVTALAAGHRPCFECRRKQAERFAALFSRGKPRARAAAMDAVLHAERLVGKAKRSHQRAIDTLPDGVMITFGGGAFAVRGNRLLRWTPSGYGRAQQRPRSTQVGVLTPPSILTVLSRGYQPLWHPSSG
ncbi:MAG TPA: hypothetical protein VLN61_00010 [Pseudolabrys sp.]|nr:hypothetical protein [Pseudolabrys sp.]